MFSKVEILWYDGDNAEGSALFIIILSYRQHTVNIPHQRL